MLCHYPKCDETIEYPKTLCAVCKHRLDQLERYRDLDLYPERYHDLDLYPDGA